MSRTGAVSRFHQEAPSLRVLRRVVIAFLVVYAPLALFAGYRAIWQVYSVSLAAEPVIHAGSTVRFGAVGSGRVAVDVELVLIQGARHDTLAKKWVREHTEPSLDPRPTRDAFVVEVTPAQLAGYEAGPATLRAIANGKSQWLRTPPPKIIDQHVVIQPSP